MSLPFDWTADEARRLAAVFRRHNVRCRIVRRKHEPSYVQTYASTPEEAAARKEALKEARSAGIDALERN